MVNLKNLKLGEERSVIREIFEYGNARKKEIGEENVFDFSLGNPGVPAPQAVSGKNSPSVNKIQRSFFIRLPPVCGLYPFFLFCS